MNVLSNWKRVSKKSTWFDSIRERVHMGMFGRFFNCSNFFFTLWLLSISQGEHVGPAFLKLSESDAQKITSSSWWLEQNLINNSHIPWHKEITNWNTNLSDHGRRGKFTWNNGKEKKWKKESFYSIFYVSILGRRWSNNVVCLPCGLVEEGELRPVQTHPDVSAGDIKTINSMYKQ